MTPTERAKRSDALYYETASVNRRVLCDMVANREADLEDARESVRRLMTQRDERLARAETDAERLRELVAGIGHLLFTLDVDYCAACPRDDINHSCPVYTVEGGECLYKTDLRELGVEVDE